MATKKEKPVRKTPQKAVTLSVAGREMWDRLKKQLETEEGMSLTSDQVVSQLAKRVGV
jgi:hypothetical protein